MIFILVAVALALNMGISNFAVAYAPSFGSGIITHRRAAILFGILIIIGALALSGRVSKTLGIKLLSYATPKSAAGMSVLFATTVTLIIANVFKFPQSTSVITISAVSGVGVYLRNLNLGLLFQIGLFWLGMSILAFALSYIIMRQIYPPTHKNVLLYEKIMRRRSVFRRLTLIINSYSSFGLGTNNVANITAPLVMAGIISISKGTLLLAPLFGVGALLFGRAFIRKTSFSIGPIGDITGLIVSLVSTTLIVFSSLLGMPAPYVQYSMMALFGVHTSKNSFSDTVKHSYVKRLLTVWLVTPPLSFSLAYVFMNLLGG